MIEPCSDITSGSTWCWRDNHCLPCHSATLTTTGVNAHLDQQNSTQQTNQTIVKSTNNRAKPGSNHQNPSPPMLLLLLHSLHNSSNHSLPLQTVWQQGRQIQCVKISTKKDTYNPTWSLLLAARSDSNLLGLQGPTQWDPNSQQPGFPLNLLPGVHIAFHIFYDIHNHYTQILCSSSW